MPSKKKLLSQVRLRDPKLVSKLLNRSSIGTRDTVLEVGPGTGTITGQLVKQAGLVIAVEKDPGRVRELKERFQERGNLEIRYGDALEFPLPQDPFKIFCNLPFAIEGEFIRRILESPSGLQDAYIILRAEYAKRWVGEPSESMFSVLHKPWWELSVFHHFRRGDFVPKPKVDSVMIRAKRRRGPLVPQGQEEKYRRFIEQGFRGGGKSIKSNLKQNGFLSYTQLKRLASDNGFKVKSSPKDLSFEQWLAMFNFWVQMV